MAGQMAGVDISQEGEIRIVSLNRPPVNAVDPVLVDALVEVFEETAKEDDCKSLVLTGANGVFSGGIDTKIVPKMDAAKLADMVHTINRMVYRLYGLPKPVVAAVPGHALGAGLIMPLACDVRLAAQGNYKVGLTEAKAGVPFPAGPLTVLKATLSPERVQYLALDSEGYAPDSTLFTDVFERLVQPDRLLEAAVAKARSLASKPAFIQVKAQLRRETLEALRQIVENKDDPILRGDPALS